MTPIHGEAMSAAAQAATEQDQDQRRSRFLTFVLGQEVYGLDIGFVREIIGLQEITEIPSAPAWIQGVINLRGKVIPIMDVRARFGMPRRAYDNRTCIIVIKVADWWVGLVVDRVSDVQDIPTTQIEPPPRVVTSNGSALFIEGLGKAGEQVLLLLDARRIVGHESPEHCSKSSETDNDQG